MTTGTLGVVETWQSAVNDGQAADATAVTADQVDVLGPRGVATMPGADLGAWMVRSGFSATPLRWYCGGGGDVVVEQDARWVDTVTGVESGRAVVGTHFTVIDGLVTRIARHDDGLQAALDSAGLTGADEVVAQT